MTGTLAAVAESRTSPRLDPGTHQGDPLHVAREGARHPEVLPRSDNSPDRGGISLETIERTKEQLSLLEHLVRSVLRKDEDYGVIPGTGSKQGTLLKPGAANVTAAFNCHAEPFIDQSLVDPSMGRFGFVNYEVHVDLVHNVTGRVLSRGYGSCNSHEAKFRYRHARPRCPGCGRETINQSKGREHGGPGEYYCWRKLGGCGAVFKAGDPAIESQSVGRTENGNPLDAANTIKKMAVKRAEVDAAMRLPGVARFFTQDLDDLWPEAANARRDVRISPRLPDTGRAPPQLGPRRPTASSDSASLRSTPDNRPGVAADTSLRG